MAYPARVVVTRVFAGRLLRLPLYDAEPDAGPERGGSAGAGG